MNLRVFCYLLLLIFSFLFYSCTEPAKVEFSIPKDKLVRIVMDIEIAEIAALSTKGQIKDSLMNLYMAQICERNEISEAEVRSNLALLHKNQEFMSEIYGEAEIKLKALNKELESKK